MRTAFTICLCLATHLHAASKSSTPTTATLDRDSSVSYDVKEELTKIATTCLGSSDYELLTGNLVRRAIARMLCETLIDESVDTIGLQELRVALKFPAPPPWQPFDFNLTKPSADELARATIEVYYDLKEPHNKMRSLDSEFLFEHNVATAIVYLDKRLPSIRTVFRKTFKEVRRSFPEVLDKQAVDRMIDEYGAIRGTIHNAIAQMSMRDFECWDR